MSIKKEPAFVIFRSSLLAAILTLVALPPGLAGIAAGNGEVGLELGWVHFDDEVADDTGQRVALRGGYFFTHLFELEARVAEMDTDEDGVDSTLDTYMLNAVFNFHPRDNVVPYVLAGAGRAELDFDGLAGGIQQDDGFAYQVAVGTRFLMGRAQRVLVRLEAASLFEDTFEESSSHQSFTIGVGLRLGR